MGALAFKALMAAIVLAAGTAGGITFAQRQGEFAHRLDVMARDTTDDIDHQLSRSPWVLVSGQAVQRNNVVEELRFTVRARDGAGADLANLFVVVQTAKETLTMPSASADAPTLTAIRDVDRSVADGRLDTHDLATLHIPVTGFNDPMGPRDDFTLTFHDSTAQPHIQALVLPFHFDGRYVDLDLTGAN